MLRWIMMAVIGLPMCAKASDLRAYTEEFPPFNYSENGANKGFANEVLNAVTAQAKLNIERKIYPWPRSVAQSEADPNSLLFTTMRTPERESHYRWIGPIDDCDMVLLKLDTRKDIQIKNAADIARYRTGFARGVADEEVLKKLGIPESQRIGVSNTSSTMPMLFAGRIDLAAGVYLSHIYTAKQAKLAAERLQVAYVLQKGFGCYFAFNPKVDERLFQRFNAAFTVLKKQGEIDKLRDHLIKPPSK